MFKTLVLGLALLFTLTTRADVWDTWEQYRHQVEGHSSSETFEVQKNLLKILLSGAGEGPEQMARAERLALTYAQWESVRLERGEQAIRPPAWSLAFDIDYLTEQMADTNERPAVVHFDLPVEWRPYIWKDIEAGMLQVMQRLRSVGEEFSRSDLLKMEDQDAELFFRRFLNFYYERLPDEKLKNMMADMIRLGRRPTQEEMLKIVLSHSGPGLGKIFQQLAKDPKLGKDLVPLLEDMEDGQRPVPMELVEKIVAADQGGHQVTKLDEVLGTGTMAQVNRAEIQMANGEHRPVAMRFLKPGIAEDAEHDLKVLRAFIAPGTHREGISPSLMESMQKLLEGLETFLKSELDLELTKKKQRQAKAIYDRRVQLKVEGRAMTVDLHVPEIYPDAGPSQLMIQELIQGGDKFEKVLEREHRQAVSRVLTRVWFEEALMDSGFIHADLHQGNFRVERVESSDHLRVHLFDLGMAEELDGTLRRAFLLIGSGVNYQNANLIAKGFSLVSKGMSIESLEAKIASAMREFPEDLVSSEQWVMWGIKEGLIVSDKLGSLARGAGLVSQLPASLGESEVQFFLREFMRRSALRFSRQYFSRTQELVLERGDVVEIARVAFRKSCQDLMSSLVKRFKNQ